MSKPSNITVKRMKEILNKYDDKDYVYLLITSFDEEDANAELNIHSKNKTTTIMEEHRGSWGF